MEKKILKAGPITVDLAGFNGKLTLDDEDFELVIACDEYFFVTELSEKQFNMLLEFMENNDEEIDLNNIRTLH